MSERKEESLIEPGMGYDADKLARAIEVDDTMSFSQMRGLPTYILSAVINSKAMGCYNVLKNSRKFEIYVRNVREINPDCVTRDMLRDISVFDLSKDKNQNWVDLCMKKRSPELIKALGKRAAERIIENDNPVLFDLVEYRDDYIGEVFKGEKQRIIDYLIQDGSVQVVDFTNRKENPEDEFVIVKEGTETIPWSAFGNSEYLTFIKIPSTVVSVGGGAFFNCDHLRSLIFPDSVTQMGYRAVGACESLTTLGLPGEILGRVDSVLLFVLNSTINGIDVANDECMINDIPFKAYKEIKNLEIPEGVTRIEDGAFENCHSLESVSIPSTVVDVGENAFLECSSIKSVEIPSSVPRIKQGSFGNCTSLSHVKIPESVTVIECSAFYGCSSLKSVTIPRSVTQIGEYAFRSDNSLKSVFVLPLSTEVGESAFPRSCTVLRE